MEIKMTAANPGLLHPPNSLMRRNEDGNKQNTSDAGAPRARMLL